MHGTERPWNFEASEALTPVLDVHGLTCLVCMRNRGEARDSFKVDFGGYCVAV
jgi:hypothetical protein